MIFFTIACIAICIGTAIAVIRSKKPVKHLLAEAKFEILYNIMGAKSLFEDIVMRKKNITDLPLKAGKVVIITGGTKGIGFEVIRMLLRCDLTVIIDFGHFGACHAYAIRGPMKNAYSLRSQGNVPKCPKYDNYRQFLSTRMKLRQIKESCRNVEVGEGLLEKFREDGIQTGDIKVFKLDVSSMESVKTFAEDVRKHYSKVHILINNAGIMYVPYRETPEGYESQLATNYLGHFLLTHLLLDCLKEAGKKGEKSRVVNLTSCAHESGKIDFEDINCKKRYIAFEAYAQSKLAQLLFSHYLNKLMETEELCVESFAVHPGIVNTDLFEDTYVKRFTPWAPGIFFKSPEKGAIPVVCAAVSPKFEGKGGSYITNCRTRKPSKLSLSDELQKNLFEFTKDLLGIEEFGKQ